ncbi:MAG: carboxymuconolactone decarboxylase family protein [Burkholderiales bacterium]
MSSPAISDATEGSFDQDALAQLREWQPASAAICERMATNPWRSGVLSRKFVELVSLAVNAACSNLQHEGTRRHIRNALAAGASRDEILFTLKCGLGMAIHSCSLGAPILIEEAQAAGAAHAPPPTPTPACDRMKAIGQWNAAWDPFYEIDPAFTEDFMALGGDIYGSAALSPKEVELMSIAIDASYTHMYAPGTRRHIRNALAAGASVQEIMEVMKLCVVQGVQALNLGVPILADELRRASRG